MKGPERKVRNKVIIEILKSIEGTKEEDLDMSVAHSNQNCLPPGGRDAHNHGLPCQDEIGILVAKKRKAGDMVDPAATLLTRKAEQWHPAKQLCDRSKVAIPLKKKLEMSKTENRAPNLVRAGEWHISNKTPVPVEHHSVAAGERESTAQSKPQHPSHLPGLYLGKGWKCSLRRLLLRVRGW